MQSEFDTQSTLNDLYKSKIDSLRNIIRRAELNGSIDIAEIYEEPKTAVEVIPVSYASIDSVNTLVDAHNQEHHKGFMTWKLRPMKAKKYNATQAEIGPDATAEQAFNHYMDNTQG